LAEAGARGKGFDMGVHVNDMPGWFSKNLCGDGCRVESHRRQNDDRILGAHFDGHEGQELQRLLM
jgi:hypothetical protein